MPIYPNRIGRIMAAVVGVVLFSAAASRAQETAAETASAAKPSNTITGRVVSLGGETVSGATAYASVVGPLAQGRNVVVDSSGNFKFEGLDPGVYFISANLAGFVVAPPPSPDEPRRYYRPGESATVTLIKGGVITGAVTTATNGPVVAAAVRAFRIKDVNGQPESTVVQARERQTDDRGVYRIYGLPPGTYVISAGGQNRSYGGMSSGAYDSDVPTYAPSSTRDTAMEVLVHSGEEVTADIQYRGEPGQAISGTVAGLVQPNTQNMGMPSGTITLTEVRSRAVLMSVSSSSLANNSFAFYGVPDGEYELIAQQYLQSRDVLGSEPRRIKVQGAEVTGINLTLTALASIAGRLVLESNPPADCVKRRAAALPETVINVRRLNSETKTAAGKSAKVDPTPEIPLGTSNLSVDSVPDPKGDFLLRNLRRGVYRVDSQLPGAGWYLRSITIGNPPASTKTSDPNVARDGVSLKSGEKISGLTVTITEGAARLRGHLSAAEGQRIPAGLRVYLVPAERENAENVLKFYEAAAESDGRFAVNHIEPGRYWILARAADVGDPSKVKPVRQESGLRARILHEAEALKKEVSFKPCEQSADYELPWASQPRQ